jgi:alpha-L-arabinofuranosidase B-like protein
MFRKRRHPQVAVYGAVISGGGGGGGGLMLDGITTGIKAAYSTRQLLTAYAGPAMQVTRASDSTTLNIGFVGNVLDTSSLATFCAGTTGSVTTWFDQSGGGNNMTPGTAPVIFASGAVTTINGKPAVSFTGSQFLSNATLSANPVNTLYQNAVISPASFTSNLAITGPSGTGGLEWRIDNTTAALDLIEASIVNLATSTNSLTVSTGAVAEVQYNSSTGALCILDQPRLGKHRI